MSITGQAPRVPDITLPRFTLPDWDEHYIGLNAWIAAGEPAVSAVDTLCSAAPRTVAADIEAKGLTGREWMSITCVSAAWYDPHSSRVVSVVLNPLREPRDRILLHRIFDHAEALAFHGSTYDIPPLYAHQLATIDHVNKVVDTLILGTLAYPSKFTPKKLEKLSELLVSDVSDSSLVIADLFSTRGFQKSEGYANVDIDSPTYIRGAASDTIQTLRLVDILTAKIVSWLTTDTPLSKYTVEEAHTRIDTLMTANRVMLRRGSRGIRCDLDYAEKYRDKAMEDKEKADRLLTSEGLSPGNGQHLVNRLDSLGLIPPKWPRTETGLLSAAKDSLTMLGDHPLVTAHRCTTDTKRINDYLDKVSEMMAVTGRLHPRAKILGAESTGRMCIPDAHRILTRRGVLTADEVRVGDETVDKDGGWTAVTGIHRYPSQETVIYRCPGIELEATDDHRWVSRAGPHDLWQVMPLEFSRPRDILLAPEPSVDLAAPSFGPATEDELLAALVGALLVTGDLCHRLVSTVPEQGPRLRTWDRRLQERLTAAGLDSPRSLLPWAISLTDRECTMFFTAVYTLAEVSVPENRKHIIVTGPEADTVMLAAYRMGKRCTRTKPEAHDEGTGQRYAVFFHQDPHIRTTELERTTGRSDVWCVTTVSGTFTAWNDFPYLTGNSYSEPPLQQFSEAARPILVDDDQGLTSIDWSAIEPLVMGSAAHDWEFLSSYSTGGDLYKPIVDLANIARSTAKVVLLALMYGQGVTSLAARLGVSEDQARALRRKVLDAMPATDAFMNRIRSVAEDTGFAVTMGNRILPIPRSSNKHKKGHSSTSRYASYLAVNWFCQGSAADILYDTVAAVEKAGYGDDIYLLMHDELVVSTPAAAEVKEIMRTPPAALVRWAGQKPVINVDRNDMGPFWKKV